MGINSLPKDEGLLERGARGARYFAAPIRIIVVPQTGRLPFIAGFPFFSFTGFASLISRACRHFTQ